MYQLFNCHIHDCSFTSVSLAASPGYSFDRLAAPGASAAIAPRHDPGRGFAGQGDRPTFDAIRRRLLLSEKGALQDALRKRVISEAIAREQLQQIDVQQIDEQPLLLEDE